MRESGGQLGRPEVVAPTFPLNSDQVGLPIGWRGRPCILHHLGPHPSGMDLRRIQLHSKVVTP